MSSAYAKTLDRSKSHGSIHPPMGRAHFEQHGYFFDHEGELIDDLLTDEQIARLKKKSAAPKPPKPGKTAEAKTAEKPEDGNGNGNGDGDEDEDGEKDHEDGLNLSAWLKGDEDFSTRDVQNAIKARYAKNCTKLVDMVEFLVEEKVVTVEQLKPDFKKLLGI